MFGNPNSKWMSALPIGSLLKLNLVWHYVDTCYIHEHVFEKYIS